MILRLALAILFLLGSQSANAFTLQRLCVLFLRAASNTLYHVHKDEIVTEFTTEDGKIHEVEKYLGNGRASTVSLMKENLEDAPVVYKVSRGEKYDKDLNEEWDYYQTHKADITGRVIPILAKHKTKEGRTVLEKPFLDNNSLYSLIKNRKLNDAQVESLRNIVDWADEHAQKTGEFLDINPFNFAWVTDTDVLKRIGKTRPSFVFYEFTNGRPKYEYLAYKSYLKKLTSYSRAQRIHYDAVESALPPLFDEVSGEPN